MCWLRARGRQPPAPAGLGTGTRPAPGRQRPGRPTVVTSAALSLGCADSGDSPVSHAPRGHPQGLSPWWTGPAPPPQAPTATYCAAPVVGGGGGCPAAPGPRGATGPDQPLPPGRRGSGEGAKPRQAPALTPQHLTRKLGERARPYWAASSSSDPSRSREDTAPSACAPLFPPAHSLRAQGPPRPTSRPGWAPAGRHRRPLHQTGAAEAGTVGGEPSGRQGPGKAPTPAHRRRGQAARAEGARRGPRRGAHGLCGLSSGRRVGHHPCPLPSPLAPRDCPGPSPPADPAGR